MDGQGQDPCVHEAAARSVSSGLEEVLGINMDVIKRHCDECVEQLGEPFEEVHRWLDCLSSPHDPSHPRHNAFGVEQIRQMFGDRAAEAAKLHIQHDTGGRVPTLEEALVWSAPKKEVRT